MKATFWQEMRNEGFILVDAPKRKIAVFPNTCGMLVIAAEDDGKCIATIDVDEVDALIELLKSAKEVAAPIDADIQAKYAIHCAMGGK
jgi:hypothetical protein